MTTRIASIALAGIVPLALILSPLAACVSTTLGTPHAAAERAETDGELLYQATVSALNGALATGAITQAAHDEAWRRAWADLAAFRAAYDAGQDLAASIAVLRADLAAAKDVKP